MNETKELPEWSHTPGFVKDTQGAVQTVCSCGWASPWDARAEGPVAELEKHVLEAVNQRMRDVARHFMGG